MMRYCIKSQCEVYMGKTNIGDKKNMLKLLFF